MSFTEPQQGPHEQRRSGDGREDRFEWSPEFWKGWRGTDDPYRQRKSLRDRELALELLRLRKGDRVLEVGCGYGWVSRAILQTQEVRWTGMDASLRMVKELRGSPSGQSLDVLVGDAHALPFPDGSFDKVLCSGVLMHLEDASRALAEMARVLCPAGRLVVSVNNAWSPFTILVRLHNLRKRGYIQRFGRPATYACRLRAMGLQICDERGDGVLASVSFSKGRFNFPPRFAFAALTSVDDWVVKHWPRCAYEVWFAAAKQESACAS